MAKDAVPINGSIQGQVHVPTSAKDVSKANGASGVAETASAKATAVTGWKTSGAEATAASRHAPAPSGSGTGR